MSSNEPFHESRAEKPRHVEGLIIGAGPVGLGALHRANSVYGKSFELFEASPFRGGLARTITDPNGFRWEIGGHVTFSHYPEFDRLYEHYINQAFSRIQRESWIRFQDTWVPYPFQQNLRYLPEPHREHCLAGLEQAQSIADPRDVVQYARSFAELIQGVFGDGISRVFMTPYNAKVWSCDPAHMGTRWLGERVAMVDAAKARENATLEQDEFGWGPNNTFSFPLDGTGALYEAIAADLKASITTSRRLIRIDPIKQIATFEASNETFDLSYEHLISSIPLDVLCRDLIDRAPDHIRDAAAGLRRASGTFVGIGVRKPCPSTTSWMYFPGSEAPFYRVTYLSNYSPRMAPEGHYSLLCEISRPAGSEPPADAVEQTIRGLEATGLLGTPETGTRDDIVSTWVHHIDHSYPVPTIDRDDRLSVIIPWLESRNIYPRGRFGLWKYEVANTDHSVMQGIELVDRLIKGTPETTIGIEYDTDQAVHIRPSVAGSGEKRQQPDHPHSQA